MNTVAQMSVLDIQVNALLQQVVSDRDRRCTALRAAADAQSQQIKASARADALSAIRKAIAEERARTHQGLRQAEARAEIEARRQEQRESQALLQHMWPETAAALERRWREPDHRRRWFDAALVQAQTLLTGSAWIIEHGVGWPQLEHGEWEDRARRKGASSVEWAPAAEEYAGLKIRAAGVCIDATVRGLLVQRVEIESIFLAEYLAAAAADPTKQPAHE